MSDLRPWDELLPIATVYELYNRGIKEYGGDPSDPKPGCVDGSLGAAWNAESYSDTDATNVRGLVFSGYLLFYLSQNHCFSDGNKRVAWSTVMHVLLHHGLTVEATADEAEKLMLEVIAGEIDDGLKVVHWLAERLVDAHSVLPS